MSRRGTRRLPDLAPSTSRRLPDLASSTSRWLVVGDRRLCEVEIASTARARRFGLLGRDQVDGALWLRPARQVHTFSMRFAIDVAYLDEDDVVLDVVTLAPGRLGPFRWRARSVVETAAGRFDEWSVAAGDHLGVTDDPVEGPRQGRADDTSPTGTSQ